MDNSLGNSRADNTDTFTHSDAMNTSRAEKPFQITGSYGPSSPEVRAIRDAHEYGNQPIALYELMQGLVDYGKGYDPPPRVVIEQANGKKYTFRGVPLAEDIGDLATNPITAISFVNAGTGMSPEDMIINRHGGNEGTLGMRGKGLKLATSYLIEQGMGVQISSHYEGHPWEGNISLTPTESNVTTVLQLNGRWKKPGSAQPITNIRINHPTDRFIAELSDTPDFFLYANPQYYDRVIVPASKHQWRCAIRKIENGSVTLLEKPSDNLFQYIYVDGLKIPLDSELSIFCWSFNDLSNVKNPIYKVKRSHDSTSAEYHNLGEVVQLALYSQDNEAILEKYITSGIDAGVKAKQFIECKWIGRTYPIYKGMAELIRRIWKKHYGKATIDNEPSRNQIDSEEKIETIYAAPGLYEFLKVAGIPEYTKELQKALKIQNTTALGEMNPLHVPSARTQKALMEFAERVANARGTIEVGEVNRQKCLHVTLPDVVHEKYQLNLQNEKPWGMILRVAAIIAYVEGLDCKIFAISNGQVHDIAIKTHANKNNENWFHSSIDITTYKLSDCPQFADYAENATHITLKGYAITASVPSKLDNAIEHFNTCIKEIAVRIANLPFQKLGFQRPEAKKPLPHAKTTWSRTGVGNRRANDTFDKPTEDALSSESASEAGSFSTGYYPEGYGTILEYNDQTQRITWTDVQKWKQEKIAQKKPGKFTNKLVQPAYTGETTLPVKTGEAIVGYEAAKGAAISFFRDTRTGIYKATSNGEEFTYYTAPSSNFEFAIKDPTPDEKENYLIIEKLKEPWKSFVLEMQADSKLSTEEKVRRLQGLWMKNFVYSVNPDLDKEFRSHPETNFVYVPELGEITTNIVNTCRGICNISATGFVMLLRIINIPSRVVYGHLVQPSGRDTHMWAEYWNGKRWIPIESQIGIKVEEPLPLVQVRPQQNRYNTTVNHTRPKNGLSKRIGWIIAGLIAAGAAAKPFFPNDKPALTAEGPAPKPIPEGAQTSDENPDEICFKVGKSVKRVYDKF